MKLYRIGSKETSYTIYDSGDVMLGLVKVADGKLTFYSTGVTTLTIGDIDRLREIMMNIKGLEELE